MDVFLPLLSQILRPFGEWIKADFYQVLKLEHRPMIREVGTKDSHQRNVLNCGEKVGTLHFTFRGRQMSCVLLQI